MARLNRSFFERDTVEIARALLGHTLVYETDGQRVGGRIVETEAYTGSDDQASHAYRGPTSRSRIMFGPAGIAYLYFIYGNYWMLNVIAKPPEATYGAAVLIRALEPTLGLHLMAERRAGRPAREWTRGPARLVMAMELGKEHNGIDMTAPDSPLYFEDGQPDPEMHILSGPRVNISAPEPWKSIPWRFWIAGNQHVSR